MINTINISKEKQNQYEDILPSANKELKNLVINMQKYKNQIGEFEDARCE